MILKFGQVSAAANKSIDTNKYNPLASSPGGAASGSQSLHFEYIIAI